MGEIITLRDRLQAAEPKPRVVATSPYLNRPLRSLDEYRRQRMSPVDLPADCETKDFAE